MKLLALLLVLGGGTLCFLWIYYERELYSNSAAIWMGIAGVVMFGLVWFLAYNATWLYPPSERHQRIVDFLLLRASLGGRTEGMLVIAYLLVLWSLLALGLNWLTRKDSENGGL